VEHTLTGVLLGQMATAGHETSVQRWQRRLLPSDLVEAPGAARSARDWTVDSTVFALAVLIGIASLHSSAEAHDPATFVADVLLGSVACLLLWARRTHPVGVGIYAIGVTVFSAFASGAAPIALFNVALRGSRRALVGLTGLAVASISVGPLVYPSNGGYWQQVIFGWLVVTVVIGWALFSRVRRELILSLRERAERVESEQRLELEQAREAERRRIAREMHDVLAHRLSLLSVHAGALEFRPDASPAEIGEAAKVIRESAQVALEELREVIGVLRENGDEGVPEPPQPTLEQIRSLVDESRAAGLDVRWRDEIPETAPVPGAVGRTAYRVVQEGLTNARKHSPAGTVDVTLSSEGSVLTVEVVSRGEPRVTDTGLVRAGSRKGLVGLSERVDLVGGALEHGSDGKGRFVLRATLPWTP
jgi:signal transduction histidine kinase